MFRKLFGIGNTIVICTIFLACWIRRLLSFRSEDFYIFLKFCVGSGYDFARFTVTSQRKKRTEIKTTRTNTRNIVTSVLPRCNASICRAEFVSKRWCNVPCRSTQINVGRSKRVDKMRIVRNQVSHYKNHNSDRFKFLYNYQHLSLNLTNY